MNAHAAVQQSAKPKLSSMLGQVATVAKVQVSSLGLRRLDKQASLNADRAHNAMAGTGKVHASRLSGAEHRVKEVSDIGKAAQDALKSMTTVWGDGQRLLANTQIQSWLKIFAPLKAEFDAKLSKLVADAPMLIAQAEANKGNYNVEVPTEDEIREAFALRFTMQQIPASDSFAASGVAHDMQEHMRRHFEEGVEAAYNAATKDALTRVADPLQHLIERISVFEKTEEEKANGAEVNSARMYPSVIGNVQDIANVFRSFNLLADPLMDSIADKLDAFAAIDIEDIKSSESLRKDLSKKASAILSDLKDLI